MSEESKTKEGRNQNTKRGVIMKIEIELKITGDMDPQEIIDFLPRAIGQYWNNDGEEIRVIDVEEVD